MCVYGEGEGGWVAGVIDKSHVGGPGRPKSGSGRHGDMAWNLGTLETFVDETCNGWRNRNSILTTTTNDDDTAPPSTLPSPPHPASGCKAMAWTGHQRQLSGDVGGASGSIIGKVVCSFIMRYSIRRDMAMARLSS